MHPWYKCLDTMPGFLRAIFCMAGKGCQRNNRAKVQQVGCKADEAAAKLQEGDILLTDVAGDSACKICVEEKAEAAQDLLLSTGCGQSPTGFGFKGYETLAVAALAKAFASYGQMSPGSTGHGHGSHLRVFLKALRSYTVPISLTDMQPASINYFTPPLHIKAENIKLSPYPPRSPGSCSNGSRLRTAARLSFCSTKWPTRNLMHSDKCLREPLISWPSAGY
ncbi:uncharacterized protein M421DRAFT_88480 [Didymella exigua CBS 183.55]|uniref:Uncharacterized protein n=1 Tax=Didymella exigua CBS 183.55 TaxID=1150837 RepID=A0A6A5S019_9PLEO|nr:uncharacterized protein M421DRAFT_88480 [Didymella exigua CBS 183.55]KAF1933213.1 hypothetical protein M421DRAFT_88480 [Didymella exigua CBS 183.55]